MIYLHIYIFHLFIHMHLDIHLYLATKMLCLKQGILWLLGDPFAQGGADISLPWHLNH